ncbi:MAG: hypothetical protein IT392_01620 [Nitrospirae bacterium]|nr:hypothetical protein [Nitrospirota bacterium]
MQDYNNYEDPLPPGFPTTGKIHQLITLKLTQMLKYNTLRLGLFTFYSLNDEDYFIIPEARYNITDSPCTSIGSIDLAVRINEHSSDNLTKTTTCLPPFATSSEMMLP